MDSMLIKSTPSTTKRTLIRLMLVSLLAYSWLGWPETKPGGSDGGVVAAVGIRRTKITRNKANHCRRQVKSAIAMVSLRQFVTNIFQQYERGLTNEAQIDACLHSRRGLWDLRKLEEILGQVKSIHSVCEPPYIQQLLAFDSQMRKNSFPIIRFYMKKKHRHGLNRFFRLFVGQVIRTCKKSLLRKLEVAETSNEQLRQAIGIVHDAFEESQRADKAGELSNFWGYMGSHSKLITFFINNRPTILQSVETLILKDMMNPDSAKHESHLSTTIILNRMDIFEAFMETKRSCLLIDAYASSSIYGVTRLAWRGYLVKQSQNESIDSQLGNSKLLNRWLRVLQYCQGALIVEARVDLSQEVPLRFAGELYNNNQQVFMLDLVSKQINESWWHRYQQVVDSFEDFDEDLECYTFAGGAEQWLMKHLGGTEQRLAKYIKLHRAYAGTMSNSAEAPIIIPERATSGKNPSEFFAVCLATVVSLFLLVLLSIVATLRHEDRRNKWLNKRR